MASFKNFLLTELISFAQFIRSRISTTAFVFGFTFSLIVFATVISINSPETSPFTIPRHSWFPLCFFSSTPNSSQFSILSLNSQRLVDPNPLNRTDMGRTGVFSYKPENTDVVLLKNFTAQSKHSPDNGTFRDPGRCNIFDGSWILDETYPGYYSPGSCPYIDEAFNCSGNGRPDSGYQRLRWKPKDCQIPRFNGKEMLERLRGKRLVFVGDSLNRNMWESLVCMLRDSLVNKSMVFEILGKHEFRNEGFYAFKFSDYNCTVEYFRSPFLVQEWEMVDSSKHRKETLRLDMIHMSSSRYKRAHIIVFNTGHWWTHDKTSKGKDYYQEGEHVYSELNVEVAFRKALHTWAKWVDANIDPDRTRVFFRGYSASHFRGGQWNSGGNCDGETKPIINDTYLAAYPPKMNILESVIGEMKTPVYYLNITRMTDYRKDGHPSVYRRPYNDGSEKWPGHQDCSHWCLPGVPDAWNELLYAALLTPVNHIRQNRI